MDRWKTFFPPALRITLGGLLLIGHGLPKISMILFDLPLWGAHVHPIPLTVGALTAALIEFVGPILLIIGWKARMASTVVALVLILSGITGPFPFFHEKVFNASPSHPFLVVPSQDVLYFMALAFLA